LRELVRADALADQHQAERHRRRGVEVRVARGVAETDAQCSNDDSGQCGRILDEDGEHQHVHAALRDLPETLVRPPVTIQLAP
jgi:hypothetical protein